MMTLSKALRICGALAACVALSQCAPSQSVSVTNHYAKSVDRVVIKDTKGIACQLENVAPEATLKCPEHAFSNGKITYVVTAADISESGLLGFVNKGGSVSFTLEITPSGKVSTGATTVGFAFGQK